jgi:hypothetical protein
MRQESSVIAATAATPAATAAAATSTAATAAINFKIFRLCVDVRPVISNSLTRKLTTTL